MDTTGKNETVSPEIIRIVLEEFAQEQKAANQNISDLIAGVNGLSSKVDELKKGIEKQKTVPAPIDIRAIEQTVQHGITDIKLIIGTQPKSIVRKFQLLLFPEKDHKLFYKIVFSRWFLMLVIMLFLNNLYQWGIHYSDNQKEIELKQVENDRLKRHGIICIPTAIKI